MINIEWLVEQGPCKSFASGDVIPCPPTKPGEQKAMYILLSGTVDVFGKSAAGGMKKVSSIIAGDVFGGREYFLGVNDYLYRASEDVNVYLLTEESFNDLSWSQPDILFEILRSSYMPPRKPVTIAAAPVKSIAEQAKEATAEKALAASAKETKEEQQTAEQLVAIAEDVRGDIFIPGHKVYTGKEFPMNEKLVYPKEYTCPSCKRAFQDYRVFRSKLYECKPMRYDLRKFFSDFNIEWYDLITCQNCLFTAFHNFFTEPKPVKKSEIEDKLTAARAEVHIDFVSPRDINTVFTMHYLALLCCDAFPSQSKQLRAKIWGNLSWLYEDVEDKEMELAAAIKAAEAYETVYTQTHLTPVQEQITCLSIAGMQLRAGISENMKKYLFKVKTQKAGDRAYAKLADDLLYELKISDES